MTGPHHRLKFGAFGGDGLDWPGERSVATPQATPHREWAASGQVTRPIGGVAVGCGLGAASGLL
jgi:hypothetical protein